MDTKTKHWKVLDAVIQGTAAGRRMADSLNPTQVHQLEITLDE